MTTLEQLRRHYPANYITVDVLLADHLKHIGSMKHLRRKITAKHIDIKIQPLDPSSKRGTWIIYLNDLADWLDRQEAAAAKAA